MTIEVPGDILRTSDLESCIHGRNIKYLKKESADFSDDGNWLVLATYRRILERVNPLMPHEKDRLAEIGKALGLRKKHVTEFLETPMES